LRVLSDGFNSTHVWATVEISIDEDYCGDAGARSF
jgi:hypothetical protein